MAKFQSYNKRVGKWVLFDGGRIKGQKSTKYKGVRVKKGKSGRSRSRKKSRKNVKIPFMPWL